MDREDPNRPDDENRQSCPDDTSRGVGEGSLSQQEENVEELLAAQPDLDGPISHDGNRGRDQDCGGHEGHIEHDEAKLDRLAVGMVAQPVRDVAEDEEHEGIGAVVEIAWPGHDREEPRGDDDDGGKPCIEGELKPLDLGLPDAGPEAIALLEVPWPAQGLPELMTEADDPGRPVRHVWPR
ncbi:hypothetical protein DC522_23895 [Microvirga sp. KLBC 81]|nr:hypothetical protein DC522_23895 [Microvirga sp. KLBC 81]